ncbi:hypothetical protein [Streptomyces sp. AS02]|uniref:hypothetical protein n=1 Tax=Streptomyces sp. AS02 TaxID=2938946 RepID=UPI0020212B1E|nr:hypothetical protein [Streptomyces sp. AS02]MCL8015150.1 hypothetical protein [Streptomyces sp. AS02]
MNAEEWIEQLALTKEHFIPSALRSAADFLCLMRTRGEGWGDYANLPVELHPTAQAVSALRMIQHPRTKEFAASAAAWTRARYKDDQALGSQELIDLLSVASADDDLADTHYRQLLAQLSRKIEGLNGDPLSTPLVAQAVLLVETWPEQERDCARPWVEEMVRRASGFRSTQGTASGEHLLVTSWLVRALAPWRHVPAVDATVSRGLEYLRTHLREFGWDSPMWSTTYPLCLVLRALSVEPDVATDLTEPGLTKLRSLQNTDGGWSGAPPAVSSVEHTTAAMTALKEFGACQYVPFVSTRSVIRELVTSLEEVTRKYKATEEDIDRQVEARLKRVLSERQRLRAQVRQLSETVEHMESERKEKNHPTIEIRRRIRRAYAFATLAAIPVVTSAVIVAIATNVISVSVAVSILAAVISAVAAFYSLLITRYRSSAPRVRERELQLLVDSFMEATAGLPPSVREEFTYRLLREGADLPRELASRSLMELADQLHIDRHSNRRLRLWVDDFSALGVDQRRTLGARLRKSVL